MYAARPASSLRLLIPMAALALLAALTLLPAPARAQESIAPTLVVATVDGTSLALIYSEALDTGSVPAPSAYSVVVGSATGVAPSSVAVVGAKVKLTLSSAPTSSDTVTVTYTKPGTNPLQDLAGNDAANLSARAVTNNTGAANNQPAFSSDATTRSVAENTAPATDIGSAVTATDSDTADTLTYSLPTNFSFFVVGADGQLRTSANLNHEVTASYLVPVYVSDSKDAAGNTDTAIDDTILVTITVTNVNEAPTIAAGGSTITRQENTSTSTILYTFVASDVDGSITFTWTLEETDAGDFTITRNSSGEGELKFRNTPDYEMPADDGADNSYEIAVKVSDGSLSAVRDVTVTVTDVNEAPTITSGTTSGSRQEDTSATEILSIYTASDPDSDTLVWSLGGDDAGDFTITRNSSGHGELKFRAVPNYETPADADADNVYNVVIQVSDGKDANGNTDTAVDATHNTTLTVTNVDEPGMASFSGALLGGSTLTANLTDIDGSISGETYRWQRADSATGMFSNITPNGTSETYVPVAADVDKYLKVRVSYTDGHGSGKMETSGARGPVGASNSDPTFSAMTATRALPENSGAGVNVIGDTITAMDSNSGDTLTYTLTGTDAGSFEIDSSGQLKTKTGVNHNFDFEATKNSYAVTVNVRDSKDAAGNANNTTDDTIDVTINLRNVNEEPTIAGSTTRSIPENSTTVGTYTATDPDVPTTYTWSVEPADDGGKFEINSSSGELTFENAPNYEMPTDVGNTAMNNTYVVTVKVQDNGSPPKSDTRTVTVTVTNINEAPTIDSGPNDDATVSEDENTATTVIIATYEASDVDTGDNLNWSLDGNDRFDFAITKNAQGHGELKFTSMPNYEMPADDDNDNDYEVTVKVSDGSLNATRDLTVSVQDVNETPVVSGNNSPDFPEIEFDVDRADLTAADYEIGTYTFYDDDGDTVTWEVTGDDAGDFTISASGVLSFDIEPDFENPVDMGFGNTYEIVVQARDNNSLGALTGTFDVTVNVTPVNETPEVTAGGATHSFAEIEYDVLNADLTSADYEVSMYFARDQETETISWSLGGDDGGDFTISSSGVLSFASRPDYETPADTPGTGLTEGDNTYEIIVKARDTASNTRDYPVTVTVTNVNETPEFIAPLLFATIDEIEYDSGIDTDQLKVIDATNANRDYWYAFMVRDEEMEIITWSLSGLDAGDFVITEDADGRGIVRWAIVPDFENPMGSRSGDGNTYVYNVEASDGPTLRSTSTASASTTSTRGRSSRGLPKRR